ncbi:hypothetical protein RHMOL_Rhmol11G0138700 [Rhododendron molle]|uniref:Uncharacterized protein n=1 Tax=Rhododendron molle TaxID=49168 RepID=A0ACC0LSW1_RHOML|nr:hypothetical protein RHMOL_Rhmol11G0138700 [Rhododendron molle]
MNDECQEGNNRLRPLSYRGADVFLLAFSVISMPSFENISKKGEELKKQIGAVAYLQCSSKTQQVSSRGKFYTTGLVKDMASLFQNKYTIHANYPFGELGVVEMVFDETCNFSTNESFN